MPDRKRIREVAAFSLLLVLITGLFILITDSADARAGGGHSYSGGGGSSGGSRSGGGGEADLIFFLIRLIIYYPSIGIPVTIIVIIVVIKGYHKGEDAWVDHTIIKAARIAPDTQAVAALTELKKRDPDFDERMFRNRAEKAFSLIQKAWSERNISLAQHFLSDGVYEQFSIQIDEMKEKGIIDYMEGLQVVSSRPVKYQSDRNFDVIHLRIDARAVNYRKNDKTGRLINGSKAPENFAEIWSFLRKPGVKTLKKPGLIEGQCPNCGNPIQTGRLAKCEVCNSLLRSGEHDWVLAGITQACEWSTRPDRVIPGLTEFMAADPGFNMQHLEDRVSVMFWRKLEAERKGNIAPLRKIARDDFCEAQKQWYKPDKGGARRFYTECATGSIDLLGIELQEPDDHVYVEVVWSGLPSIFTPAGAIETAPKPINFRHVFILGRRHGVQTKVTSSLASSHCPACGAPEQTGSENACAYCGNVMNDGSGEWVLEAVADRNEASVAGILTRMNQLKKRISEERRAPANAGQAAAGPLCKYAMPGSELIRWATAMMLADGEIDAKEMEMIVNLANQRDVSNQKLQEIITELKAQSDPVDFVMKTSTQAADNDLLRHLARVALADGRLSNEETAMLRKIGQKINLGSNDIDLLLSRERKNLYQEAKAAIAQARRNR